MVLGLFVVFFYLLGGETCFVSDLCNEVAVIDRDIEALCQLLSNCCRSLHSYRFVVGNILILVGIISEERSLPDKFI
ncbi:hypothetical protein, partial [Ruminococcus sp.]|uniref:hypothetical protein n=1 Tax=Ruminococcus sp. TaxID=41978 RepID=UPI002D1FB49B